MRSDSADQKKDRHGMVNMYFLRKSCSTFLWKLDLRPSCWSRKLSRAQLLRFGRGDHQRHPDPTTAPRQVAGLSSVAGRCVFGIVNRPSYYLGAGPVSLRCSARNMTWYLSNREWNSSCYVLISFDIVQ